MSYDPYVSVYDRGIAVGFSDIKTDTMHFQYKGERFEFPSALAHPHTRYNGYFYEARIDDLRRLKAQAAET